MPILRVIRERQRSRGLLVTILAFLGLFGTSGCVGYFRKPKRGSSEGKTRHYAQRYQFWECGSWIKREPNGNCKQSRVRKM